MRNYIIFFLACFLLAGCAATEEGASSPKDNTSNVAGEAESVTSAVKAPMTAEEALILAEDIESAVYNHSIMLYDDSGELTRPEEELMASLAEYATDEFIEQNVILHEDLCMKPCYTIEMPSQLYRAWQPTVHFASEEEFSITALFANLLITEGSYSFEETTIFKLEGDTWKLDTYSSVEKDMNLTEADIEPYLTQLQYTFDEIGPAETVEFFGRDELVYSFPGEADGQIQIEQLIVARTGYVQADYSNIEVETYGDDPIYDLLFYPWSDNWDQIDTSNPVIADFLTRLDAIDMRIFEAWEGENGVAVATEMVEEYTALHTEVYETYTASLGEDDHERYEMENRNWYFHFTNSLSDYVPDEATEVDAILMQAEALKNRIYSILVNEKLE